MIISRRAFLAGVAAALGLLLVPSISFAEDKKLTFESMRKIMDEMLPSQNKGSGVIRLNDGESDHKHLFDALTYYKIKTESQLRTLINKRLHEVLKFDGIIARQRAEGKDYYFCHSGLIRGMLQELEAELYLKIT